MNVLVLGAGLGALLVALFAVLVADHGRYLTRPCPPERRVLIREYIERHHVIREEAPPVERLAADYRRGHPLARVVSRPRLPSPLPPPAPRLPQPERKALGR